MRRSPGANARPIETAVVVLIAPGDHRCYIPTRPFRQPSDRQCAATAPQRPLLAALSQTPHYREPDFVASLPLSTLSCHPRIPPDWFGELRIADVPSDHGRRRCEF